jgi:hypothetical protein
METPIAGDEMMIGETMGGAAIEVVGAEVEVVVTGQAVAAESVVADLMEGAGLSRK